MTGRHAWISLAGAALVGAIAAAGCGGGADEPAPTPAPSLGAQTFVRGPYLTQVTRTEARLRWIAPDGARVRISATAADGTTVRARRGHFHDLAPGTAHRWLATIDGTPAASGSFATAPTDLSQPIDVIAFGDYGALTDASRAVAARAAREDARLLITTGDNAYLVAAPQTLDSNIFTPLRDVLARMPNYGTLGDHDIVVPAGRRALVEAFEWPGDGERYAREYGPLQVVALGLEAGPDDVTFARRALARPGPLARVVVTHRPIHEGNPLLDVIARADVTAVLAGHLHAYERRMRPEAPGVPFFTVGTGGAPRNASHTPRSPDAAVHIQEYGLLRIRLEAERVRYEFVDTDGLVRDRLETPLVL